MNELERWAYWKEHLPEYFENKDRVELGFLQETVEVESDGQAGTNKLFYFEKGNFYTCLSHWDGGNFAANRSYDHVVLSKEEFSEMLDAKKATIIYGLSDDEKAKFTSVFQDVKTFLLRNREKPIPTGKEVLKMERCLNPKKNIQDRILIFKLNSPSYAGECEFGYSLVCCDGIWQFELGYHAATNSPMNRGFDYIDIPDEVWTQPPYEALRELVVKNTGHHPDIKGRGTCVEWEKLEQLFETKKKEMMEKQSLRTNLVEELTQLAERKTEETEKTQSLLEKFVEKGYLIPVYSDKSISAYVFLDRVCVAFDPAGDSVGGVLLTKAEMELLVHSGWDGAFHVMRNSNAKTTLDFTSALLEKCGSFFGRISIKRMLRKRGYKKCLVSAEDLSAYGKLDGFIVKSALNKYIPLKEDYFKIRKKSKKRMAVALTIGMLSVALSMLSLCTKDLRQQWGPLKTPVAFDRNAQAGTYCSVEVDFLAEYWYYSDTTKEYTKGSPYGTYYLFGNSKTGQYGILKFESSLEQGELLQDDDDLEILKESITLYGTTRNMMSRISQPRPTEPSTTPVTGTMPGGWPIPQLPTFPTMPVILMPGEMYLDRSEQAWRLFSKYVFEAEGELPLGEVYLDASVHQEKERLAVNEWIDMMFFVGLLGFFISWVFVFPFAGKVDYTGKLWKDIQAGELLRACLAEYQPVRLVEQRVEINVGAFIIWCKRMKTNSYELNGAILLRQNEPVIELHEGTEKPVAYRLQCEPGEDFLNKYFLISVRLGLRGKPIIPLVQIDGIISDTPQERKMKSGDVAYRMEGHYLAVGGAEAEKRYEQMRGMDLVAKGLKYPGITTPANVRLVGVCPECKMSFAFHGYAFYMIQNDVAYSDDGLDTYVIREYDIDKETWVHQEDGKTFRYYNSFNCPCCGTPYIDYKKHPEMKNFGVSGCVHIGRRYYGK